MKILKLLIILFLVTSFFELKSDEINDVLKNKILKKKISSQINVTMIHGDKDEVVPKSYSKKVLRIFNKGKKKLLIIKNGDHSLSNKNGLKK